MSALDTSLIYSALTGVSPLPAGGRVYPDVLPQKVTYPAITYIRISTSYFRTLTGSAGLEDGIFQVDSWAQSHTEAWSVADAVTTALENATTFRAQRIGAQQLTETEAGLDLFRVMQEFSIMYF